MRIESNSAAKTDISLSFENSLARQSSPTQNMPQANRSHRATRSSHAANSDVRFRNTPSNEQINAWTNYNRSQNSDAVSSDAASLAQAYINNLDDGDRVLDLGTGAGYFPLKLAKAAEEDGIQLNISAVDFIPPNLFQNVRQSYSDTSRSMVNYVQANLENFSPTGSYNLINADGTLPYLQPAQQIRLVQNIANTLAPYGNAAFQVVRGRDTVSHTGMPIYALDDAQFNSIIRNMQTRNLLPSNTEGSIDQNGSFTTVYLYNPGNE